MYAMFRNSPFNQPLHSWDVSNVENMDEMFAFSKFNHPLDLWKLTAMREKPKDMFLDSDFQGGLDFLSTITPNQEKIYTLKKEWKNKLNTFMWKNRKNFIVKNLKN